jgi:hypothetical protein
MVLENIAYPRRTIMSVKGRDWIKSLRSDAPCYRKPDVPVCIVETKPVNVWPYC